MSKKTARQLLRGALIVAMGLMTAACSEKAAPVRETDAKGTDSRRRTAPESERETAGERRQPDEDQIAEDCVAFVRSTKVVPARAASTDCPGCPAGGSEALSFRHMEADAISCSGDRCTVGVTIRAVFNPASGEQIAGGLTGWIPQEQRTAYLSGRTPPEEQTYRVQITYTRQGERWRAVEFERASVAPIRK